MRDAGHDFFPSRRGVAHDVHSGLTENQVMLRTLVAMSIPAILAVIAMGSQAFFNILTALVASLVAHYIMKAVDLRSFWKLREATYESAYSPLVAGMIVGLCMGELSPYYVTAFVSALTMIVFKWGQEKYFGRKVVNPAAGAKALVLLGLTLIWALPDSLTTGMLFYPEHLQYALYTEDGFLGAMQLAEQMGFYGTANLSITQSLILWKRHGWIGGASGIATLGVGILLAYWIKLKWRIAVSFLVGMGVLSVILGLATGGHIAMRIAFHVLTGSVIFLAFFMATEPQTTPVTFKAQYLFGGVLALLTMVLQLAGLFGSSFVDLAIMNPFAAYFDRVSIKQPFGAEARSFSPAKSLPSAPDTTSPVLKYDPSKCIKCSRCIKACEEIQGNAILGYGSRGKNIFATAGLGERGSSACTGCGECIELCPTGALTEKHPLQPLRDWETETVITTCSYCGVGCQLKLLAREGNIAKVRGVDRPPNNKSLCIRGRFGHTYRDQTNRLTQPLRRREDSLEPVTWEEALQEIADKLASFAPEEIGGLSSAQNTNEESYLFQKFMRGVLGTNNIDFFSRINQAGGEIGLQNAVGRGVMTNSIEELLETDCILIAEAEVNETHPIVSNYIKQAVDKRDVRLVSVNTHQHRLTDWAEILLKPDPGTTVAWVNSMMKVIIDEELYDEEFVKQEVADFAELKASLADYTPKNVAEITDLAAEDIRESARIFAGASRAAIVYNSSLFLQGNGVNNTAALANLALLTGNLDQKATGLYPLKDQNNDQGAQDMGNTPDYLPGYQQVASAEIRNKFSESWNSSVPGAKGFNAVQMVSKAISGDLKAIILQGESEAFSEPYLGEIARALDNLDFIVAVTPFLNDAAAQADIVLPAATFGEKNGTFTNMERRVQRVRKLFDPPEEACTDWKIFSALAARMNYPMNYDHPSEIMSEISLLTPLYGGINYFSMESGKGMQWPCDNKQDCAGTPYLQGILGDKERRFLPAEYDSVFGELGAQYPLKIVSGRILYHFRTGFTDPQTEALQRFLMDPYLDINPADAEEYELEQGGRAKVVTPYGNFEVETRVTERVKSGVVFIPYQFLPLHYTEGTYQLRETGNDEDYTDITVPEYKLAGCRLEKIFNN